MTATLHDLLKSYREGGVFPSYDQLAALIESDQSGAVAGCALRPKRFILDTNGLSYEQIAAISAEYRIDTHIVSCIINAAIEAAPLPDQGGAAVRGEAVAEFNINDMMMVTLTPEGAAVWNQRYANLPLPADLIPEKVDAGYVLKDQLWDLMEVFGPHTGLGRPAMFVGMRMAHTKPVAAILSARAADAPSEPSELPTTIRDGMHWPEGYVTDPNGKIIPPKGRYNDFKFGCDVGYGEGLASIKDTVANIGAQAVAKSRAADALDSQPTEPVADVQARVRDAVAENLRGLYYCGRVWSAWSVGTMGEDDFSPAEEDDDIIANITDAVMATLSPASSQPTVSAVFAELRADLRELANNTDTFGEHSQEAARVAFDSATDALDEVAAKYASSQPTDGGVRNGQLMRFYAVETVQELIDAQEQHIAKLQAKLPRDTQPAFTRVREG